MNESSTPPVVIGMLNRILRILCRSLPMYLEEAQPWSRSDQQRARTALARLTADQHALARRVVAAILDHGGQPDPGGFPIEFTGLNDVSLEYILQQVLKRLRCDVDVVEHCTTELAIAPDARALADEVLGNLHGHLDLIAEVVREGETAGK